MSEYKDEFRRVQGEAYWSAPRLVLGALMIMAGVYVLGFIATGGDLVIYRFWAPKQENARREVFENTQSYVQGKTDYINALRLDYQGAEGVQKEALRRTILTEAGNVDISSLPVDLRSFVASLGGTR